MKPIDPAKYRRAAVIVGVVCVTAAVSGYFMGLQQTSSHLRSQPTSLAPSVLISHDQENQEILHAATGYAEQRRLQDGPNKEWESHISKLVQPVVDIKTLTNVTETSRAASIHERKSRRAYDGAPPVVPHPIAQDSSASCLACHSEGLTVKDKVAPKMSHAQYTSCTQCHVPALGSRIPLMEASLLEPLSANTFSGLDAPLKGSRAWALAPPTIPHGTMMRSDCLSCHGPQGLFGLRTPHPDRRSCQQCHVPSAEIDQRLYFRSFAQESIGDFNQVKR